MYDDTIQCPDPGCKNPGVKRADGMYECVSCGRVFDPESKTAKRHKHDIEHNLYVDDKGIYECCICEGRFHIVQRPAYKCKECKRLICAPCYKEHNICRECVEAKQQKAKTKKNQNIKNYVKTVLGVLLFLGILDLLSHC